MDQTPFPAQNSSKQIFWCILMEFFTGGSRILARNNGLN